MEWGAFLVAVVKLFVMWCQNRYDPKMIRLREFAKIRNAKEEEHEAINRAIARGDTGELSRLWSSLSA